MVVVVYLFLGILLTFAVVVFFGAPYLPTLKNTKQTALDILDLAPGQTLLELGSGDGRMMLAAAQRGLNVVGYELNPILVLISIYKTRKYKKQVRVIWGNFFKRQWPAYDGVYVFLVDRYMAGLDKKIRDQKQHSVLVASNSFKIPGKKPIKQSGSVYLYRY